jgi:hypothetical protein
MLLHLVYPFWVIKPLDSSWKQTKEAWFLDWDKLVHDLIDVDATRVSDRPGFATVLAPMNA